MSRVSYFQRFSQRENHATNNTLLVIRHFYQHSPQKVEAVLSALAEDELSVGLSFEQQIKSQASVPDALISQRALEIYFETKRGGDLDKDQIARHMDSIAASKNSTARKILFGLTRTPIAQSDKDYLAKLAKGITFVPITFADIVGALRSVSEPFETELKAVLSDYEEYLVSEELLQIGDILTVVPCGTSIKENVEYRLYFEPADRPSKKRSKFIGFYSQKCVRYLATPVSVITGIQNQDGFNVSNTEFGYLSDDEKKRIEAAIRACAYFPDFAQNEHRYYLFDEVHETAFTKKTKGGIWGTRVFNLSEWLDYDEPGKSYSAQEAAELLRGNEFD